MSTPRQFRIEHNGSEWSGTFGVTVTAAVTDMLTDGPFDATMTLETVAGESDVGGTIVDVDDEFLHLLGGRRVDRGALLAIEIA